jgi:hypothetical protein
LLEPDEMRSRLGELKRAGLSEQKRGRAVISSRLNLPAISSTSGVLWPKAIVTLLTASRRQCSGHASFLSSLR